MRWSITLKLFGVPKNTSQTHWYVLTVFFYMFQSVEVNLSWQLDSVCVLTWDEGECAHELPQLWHMTCTLLLPLEKYALLSDKTARGQTRGLFGWPITMGTLGELRHRSDRAATPSALEWWGEKSKMIRKKGRRKVRENDGKKKRWKNIVRKQW